jgi:CDP-diacylglycerol--serine O-phosphatidyltransferase
VIAYAAGMQGGWDRVILVYFVACGVSRLARFNVTADQLASEEGKVKYYEGTPIPTSIVLVMILAAATWFDYLGEDLWGGVWQLGPWELHPLALLFAVSGTLMISTIRIPKP